MLRIRHVVLHALLLLAGVTSGCDCGQGELVVSQGGGGEAGAAGKMDEPPPCGIDCSAIPTPPCTVAVCNTGQEIGPINTCVVVAAPSGTPCDDGVFCTMNDTCDGGACVGGPPNDCAIPHRPCEAIICAETTKTCSIAPVDDGMACTPEDLCEVDGVCELGECIGEPKDCSISPLSECNSVACDPATGQCLGVPDPSKDFAPCVLTGDPCQVNKTCLAGDCGGGSPKDCSQLDAGCEVGVCDPPTGICVPQVAPDGSPCGQGISECQDGVCDNGACKAEPAPNGTACNDHDACTSAEFCSMGACQGGSAVVGCSLYFKEGFEVCPNGWTFAGDWECGSPSNVGPTYAHNGSNVLATNVNGVYSVNQAWGTAVADSPPIDLTGATSPVLSFWAWEHTEGGSFDGWNLKVSTNGGFTFNTVPMVSPPYTLMIGGQQAWGGNHSAEGWRNFQADLSAYAGQTIVLRFAFRSDGAAVYPGVYIDDLFVAEPLQNALYITSSTTLPDLYSGVPMATQLTRNGGTAGAVWSIVPGGVNDDWLAIDPATGVLSGTPTMAEVGPVSVTVRVEESLLPTNYDEATIEGFVNYAAYYTSFEGACPAGWTLGGTWECGVPTVVGPPLAYTGSQCLGTNIDGNYADYQTYSMATATSPDIDLSGSAFPTLTFRMWVDTEGLAYDGFNLKVSNDGGMTYNVVTTVVPAYPLTVAGEPAWGGHQQALGWQYVQANLAAYNGQVIKLRLSFQSDSFENYAGVYIDDFLVQ